MPDMVITLLVSLIVVEAVALAAALAYCRAHVSRTSPDDEPSDAVKSRDGLLGDYQGVLRETLARIGVEGENIADMGEQISERENDMSVVLRMELTARVNDLVKVNGALRSDLASAQERLEVQCAALKRLSSESRHDCLTQLPNRRAFDERLVELFGRHQRYHEEFVMVIFDVDGFKLFNDNYGHAAGDAVLAAIAKVVSERRRSTDFVARIGGEEFAILLTHTTLEKAESCVGGYRKAIEATTLRTNGQLLRVTASFGAAEALPGESANDLKERADRALYAAKASGRNCARFHDGNGVASSCAEQAVGTA
jgi:diguanylate cyclase (GGDEF)-like protein